MPSETPYDPARGEAAYRALADRLAALAPADIQRPNSDLFSAGLRAIGVAKAASADDLGPRFASLPAAEFDAASAGDLDSLGWAALYAHTEALKAEAQATAARLPAELVARAVTLKQRMLTAADYYLTGDSESAAEVAAIRSGQGYQDLATDLLRLAALYDGYPRLGDDGHRFRRADAAAARQAADEIVTELAAGAGPWNDRSARVWTLLRRSYDEVRVTAHWLLRHEPHRLGDFPALGAPQPGRRSSSAPTATGEIPPDDTAPGAPTGEPT
jgi:hypothetical protein